MARYLITQTLLSSFAYQFNCAEGQEEAASEEFMNKLKRVKEEPSEAMLNGIEFENEVYKLAGGYSREPHKTWESGIQAVATVIRGAPFQVKASRPITVDGMEFLVYGILDALKAGTIYDVKFKNKRFSSCELAGSYLSSPQHPAYFYLVPEATRFKYLVSDGTDLYVEEYTPDSCPYIGDLIHEFIVGMTPEQKLLYMENWKSK